MDKEYILYNFEAKVNDTIVSTALSRFQGQKNSIQTVLEEITMDTVINIFYKLQKISSPCFPSTSITDLHQKFGCLSEFMDVFFPEDYCQLILSITFV